jgi:hypothetical protein
MTEDSVDVCGDLEDKAVGFMHTNKESDLTKRIIR